jgi:photoactive yellow protein
MSLQLLDSVFDNLPLGVVVLDANGKVVVFNRAEQELAGRSKDRVMGREFFVEVAPCMNLRELGHDFRTRVGDPRLDVTVEMSFPFPHVERPRDVRVRMKSLDVAGAPHALLMVEDISLAREAARMRETLQSLPVHDLKNPLAAIVASIGLLEDLPSVRDSKDAMESIEEALAASRRLTRMMVDLLDLARLESAQMELRRAPHGVAALLERVANDNRAAARSHGCRLVVAPCGALTANVDADLIVRALDNLVENAVRNAKTVHLSATRAGTTVAFRVADDGPGIPEAIRATLFDKYVQVQQPDSGRGTNRGLGLTFVKLVACEHGGDVDVTCPASGGSIFNLTIREG